MTALSSESCLWGTNHELGSEEGGFRLLHITTAQPLASNCRRLQEVGLASAGAQPPACQRHHPARYESGRCKGIAAWGTAPFLYCKRCQCGGCRRRKRCSVCQHRCDAQVGRHYRPTSCLCCSAASRGTARWLANLPSKRGVIGQPHIAAMQAKVAVALLHAHRCAWKLSRQPRQAGAGGGRLRLD